MFRSHLPVGCIAPCLLLAAPAAADPLPPPSPSDIVVTATRSARPLAEAAASVTVVTAAQIAATPARTLDDVLRRVASVDLPAASAGEQHPTDTVVSMRGLGGLRALVLLDGVPINDPFFGYVQWGEVPLGAVDRIEVVRGGGATLWGNYAMGGVINVLTKPIDRTGIAATAAGGSRGTVRADGRASLAGEGYGVALDGGVNRTGGYVEQVEEARGPVTARTASDARTIALSGNADLSSAFSARARVGRYDDDRTFLTRLNRNRQRTWRVTASVRFAPDDRGSVELAAFRNDERFVTDNTGAPDGADPRAAEYVQNSHATHAHDWGASLVWTRSYAGIVRALTAGADYHGIRGRDDARIFAETRAYLRTDSGAGAQRFLGGFAQAELRPAARLQLLASLRYQEFRGFDGVDDTPGGQGRVAGRRSRDVNPRLSARYDLGHGVALRAAAYRAFRAPTLDNLYRAASVPGYILYGNPALKPETLVGAEAGIDIGRGPLRAQVTAYTARVSDFLTYRYLDPATLPAGFGIGARLINAGRARSRGVEAELRWTPSPALEATIAYTYADTAITRNPEDPASVGVRQPGVPRHRVSAGLDWTGPGGIVLSPRVRYVGATNGDPDDLYRTDAHAIVDLGGSVGIAKGVRGFVQVENLLDRRYVGTNDGFTPALYGRPLTATAGVRLVLG